MKKAKQTKAARFCAASRIVGYGGVLACAVAAAAWYILTVPVGGKSLDDLDKVAGLLPLPLLIAAGAAVLFILAAIVLRIVAYHYEKKMFANAARRKFEKLRKEVSKHAKTGVRKAKEVGKDLSEKISAAAEQAKKSHRENAKICKAERRAARREDKRLRKAIAKREQAEARLALQREKDAEKAARKAVRKGIRQPEPVPAVKFNRTMLCPRNVIRKVKRGTSAAVTAMATGAYTATERVKAGVSNARRRIRENAQTAKDPNVSTCGRVKRFVRAHPVLSIVLPISVLGCLLGAVVGFSVRSALYARSARKAVSSGVILQQWFAMAPK